MAEEIINTIIIKFKKTSPSQSSDEFVRESRIKFLELLLALDKGLTVENLKHLGTDTEILEKLTGCNNYYPSFNLEDISKHFQNRSDKVYSEKKDWFFVSVEFVTKNNGILPYCNPLMRAVNIGTYYYDFETPWNCGVENCEDFRILQSEEYEPDEFRSLFWDKEQLWEFFENNSLSAKEMETYRKVFEPFKDPDDSREENDYLSLEDYIEVVKMMEDLDMQEELTWLSSNKYFDIFNKIK